MPSRYAQWMHDWEHRLSSFDNNRVVRRLEWGVEWARDWPCRNGWRPGQIPDDPEKFFVEWNRRIVADSDTFYAYDRPDDYRLERREVQVFSTREVPDLKLEAKVKGSLADFLRFTSPVRTPYPENDTVNARWYPAEAGNRKQETGNRRPKQAMIVMPQWNADAFSHNAFCTMFNRFGISCLRLSKPYHDIRRPLELERSDYAVSSNIGRTISSCRQAVVDIRSCIDWLQSQGYEQIGVLGTSLGSCYSFIAAAMDPRIRVCAFNYASTWFGDVVWTGQSTRH